VGSRNVDRLVLVVTVWRVDAIEAGPRDEFHASRGSLRVYRSAITTLFASVNCRSTR